MDERATLERLLKRQLALAFPIQVTLNDQTFTMFRATANRIEFVADYSLADGPADFRKIDYAVEHGQFLYGEQSMFEYVPTAADPAPTRSIGEFGPISFRFLSTDERGSLVWSDEWKPDGGLPVAVGIRVADDSFVVKLVNR